MRRSIRPLGVAVAAVLVFAAPLPTRAQTSPTVAPCDQNTSTNTLVLVVQSPVDAAPPLASPDTAFSGCFDDRAQNFAGEPTGIVRSVKVTVVADTPDVFPPPESPYSGSFSVKKGTFDFAASFPMNGRYTATVRAEGSSTQPTATTQTATQTASQVVHVAFAVPPAKPTGVRAVVGDSGVTVTWADNPEPDIRGYEVRRAAQGSKTYTLVTTTPKDITTIIDPVRPGEWQYVVRAVRPDADGNATLQSSDSSAALATVVEPPTTTTTSGSTTGATTSGAGSSTTLRPSVAASAPTGTATPTAGASDLSKFGALLQRQKALATRTTEPDTGFAPTLPFKPGEKAALGTEGDNAKELGSDQPASQGLGQRPISDGGDRRRSLGMLAFGLLLFVLSMAGLFVKGEVKRADELEPLEPEAHDAVAAISIAPVPPPAHSGTAVSPARMRRRLRTLTGVNSLDNDEFTPRGAPADDVSADGFDATPGARPAVSPLPPRRLRAALPPLDAPGLDVPQALPSRPVARRSRVPAR